MDRTRSRAVGEREVAMAAGTAVHRVLEELDLQRLAEDPAWALGRGRERLPEMLGIIAAGDRLDRAVEAADTLLDRFALGPLLERLAAVAEGVVARELPVLVRVEDREAAEGPVGFLAGSVDLLYRDPETGLPVVADYKTDRVENDEAVTERVRLYAPQARAYARAIQEALGLPEPPRAELWFLWPGRIEAVGERAP